MIRAFIGGPFARWRALLPGGRGFGRRLRQFVRGTIAGKAPFYMGHNPVARVFLPVLMLLLLLQAGTGLVLAGTDVYMPPFGGAVRAWVAGDTHDPAGVRPYASQTVNDEAYVNMRAFRAPIVGIHEYNFFALLVLISVHIAAAIFTEFREGGTVISAMFTGSRWHADEPVDRGLAGGAGDDGVRGPGDNAQGLAPTREVIELTQTVDVTVDNDGRPTMVVIPRWSDANADKSYRLQPFGGYLSDFRDFDGYMLPTRVEGGNFIGTEEYFPFYEANVESIRFVDQKSRRLVP